MPLYLIRPSEQKIRRFLESRRGSLFSYPNPGLTRSGEVPAGYSLDRSRAVVGQGAEAFDRAAEAMRQWGMFDLGWTSAYPLTEVQEEGGIVGVLAWVLGIWSLNACRIVYTVDENGPLRRLGFAYGTLPGHVQCGEESFLLELDDDGTVSFEITAVSRPRHPLAWMAYPLVRRRQARFRRDSLRWMARELVDSKWRGSSSRT